MLRACQRGLSTCESKPSCCLLRRQGTSRHALRRTRGAVPSLLTTYGLENRKPGSLPVCRASQWGHGDNGNDGRASSEGQFPPEGVSPAGMVLANPQQRVLTISGVVAGFFLLGFAIKRGMMVQNKAGEEAPAQLATMNSMTAAQVLKQSTVNPDMLEVAHYRTLQAFNFPTYGKLLAILAVGLPLVVLGAFFYRKTSGAEWGDSLWKAYSIAADIPGSEIDEETPKANFVLNMVHIFSLCTFAVLVGVFTSEIEGGVEALKTGNFPLPETGHTVVLGWSTRQSVVLLKEILEAHSQRGKAALQMPVVLLGTEDKGEMDEALMNEFGDVVNRLVVTRQGSPTRPLDLARVSASRASTVIWMPPEAEEEEMKIDANTSLSATLASLHSLRRQGSPPQRVMVCEDAAGELEGWNEAPSGRLISDHLLERGTQITSLADLSNLNGIMAQVGLQPGLSAVFEEVCQHACGNYEFYSLANPSQRDITFRQARKGFPKAVLMGVVDVETGATHLSPSDDFVISPNDVVLLMAEGENALTYHPRAAERAEAASLAAKEQAQREQQLVAEAAPFKARKDGKPTTPEQRQEQLHKPEKVVVLGFGGNVKRLADSLADFCPPGSKITLAIPEDPSCDDDYKILRASYDGLKINDAHFRVLRGNMSSNMFLRKAGVTEADSVILGAVNPSDGWEPADADALVVATTLQLHSLLEDEASKYLEAQASTENKNGKTKGLSSGKVLKGNRPLSVVSCVAEERTKDVLNNIVAPRAAWQGNPVSTSLATTKGTSRGVALQVIMTQELMSGMLTQVASDPMLLGLFEELLRDEGSELYMRAPEVYGVPVNVTKSWDEVQDAVRQSNTICMGYLDQFGKVHLGVESGTNITLMPTEKLVVIAES